MARSKLPLFVRITLGIFFLILGIIGLIFPVVPQVAFFILAAGFLGWDAPKIFIKKLRRKYSR